MAKKKKQRDSERSALLHLALARDGELPPKLNPVWAQPEAEQEEIDANGALIIRIDDDLEIPDLPTSVLPPVKGRRTKTTDKDRYYKWFLDEELMAPGA